MIPPRTALLVIDVQNDFCPGGALAVNNGNLVVPPLNQMIEFFEKNTWPIYFSRDWHPHTTKHFKEFGGIWPAHCICTTWGAQFHPNLIIPKHSFYQIVTKGESNEDDGYSPFEGTVKTETPAIEDSITFHRELMNRSVNTLYIGGLATDYCVKAACLDARKLGYTVYLLTDACRAVNVNPGDEALALNEMANAGVIFITTDEVLQKPNQSR